MSDAIPAVKQLRLAVICTDSLHVACGGGQAETSVKLFDLPEEIQRYIREIKKGSYSSVSLALESL